MREIETFKQIPTLNQRFDLMKFIHGTTLDLNMIYGISHQQNILYRPLLETKGVAILSNNPTNTERFLTMLLYQYYLYNNGTQSNVLLVVKDGHSSEFTELVKMYPHLTTITATTENINKVKTMLGDGILKGVPPKIIIFHELVQVIIDVDTTKEDINYELTRQIQDLYILAHKNGQVPILTGNYKDTILEYKEGFVYTTDRIYISNRFNDKSVPFQLVRKSSPVLDTEIYTMLSISQNEPIYKEELRQLNSVLLTNYYYLEKKKDLQLM